MPPPAPGCSLARPPPIQIVPPRTRRPSTASGKVRYVHEVGELGDDIDNFERMRGLTMAAEGLPEWDTDVVTTRKSWAERKDQVEHELRMEALAERFKSGAHRPTRGSQHDLDPCHRRPVPVRPASAAPRPLGLPVTDTARTDALLQSYIDMHKESAEQHNMALQEALLEKIRVHKERTQTRRNAQRSTMQLRREASRDFAVQLQHPFFVKQARGPRERAAPPWACARPCTLALPGESLAAHMTAVIACARHAPLPHTLATHARPAHLVDHPIHTGGDGAARAADAGRVGGGAAAADLLRAAQARGDDAAAGQGPQKRRAVRRRQAGARRDRTLPDAACGGWLRVRHLERAPERVRVAAEVVGSRGHRGRRERAAAAHAVWVSVSPPGWGGQQWVWVQEGTSASCVRMFQSG